MEDQRAQNLNGMVRLVIQSVSDVRNGRSLRDFQVEDSVEYVWKEVSTTRDLATAVTTCFKLKIIHQVVVQLAEVNLNFKSPARSVTQSRSRGRWL